MARDTRPWEAFVAEHFPGYLLPESHRRAMPEEVAAHFLETFTGRPDQLAILRGTSFTSARVEMIRTFALDALPRLARHLPPATEIEQRVWEGKLRGRLDVAATLQRRLEGRASQLVTRSRRRSVDLPENVLVKSTARRLADLLARLRDAGALAGTGWSAPLAPCEAALERALAEAPLCDVGDELVSPLHEQAARGARHEAYALAARLHRGLREGVEGRDPQAIARIVAEGALAPLPDHTRFEIAVLLRLVQSIERELDRRAPGSFELRRSLVMKGRREVAAFERGDGAAVRIFYNQAVLPPGPCDRGVERYLGQRGRLRPDVTVTVELPGAPVRAVVIEVKLSSDPEYLAQGYKEALLYRAEYAASLAGWPKAILVASSSLAGEPRRDDEVIAIDWDRWVPESVVEGVLEGL